MPDDRAPDRPWTMTFPWKPGATVADESEQEAPAPGYPRGLRRYAPLEPPTETTTPEEQL
jgi:hypothetical protein